MKKFLVGREGEERGSASSLLMEEGREGGAEDGVMSERAPPSFLQTRDLPSMHPPSQWVLYTPKDTLPT